MIVPGQVIREIELARGERITNAQRLDGGCISPAARLDCEGNTYFLKWAEHGKGALLAAEAHSLERIADTGTMRVPHVHAYGLTWLLLEWIQPGSADPRAWIKFGKDLARLHRVHNNLFGWPEPNFIGSLPQANTWTRHWAHFWRNQRLEPQLSHAVDAGLLGRPDVRRFEQLMNQLEDLLEIGDRERPSLLHGDLWSGNAHAAGDVIVAVDPSSYYGHREVDLAMADLFGGFPPVFREAYEEDWPTVRSGFDQRKATYQLYYLLVHINLFGGGYVASTRNALTAALG